MELGWGKVYGAIIPGYCILCSWDNNMLYSKRIRAFTDRQEWEDHVGSHDITAFSNCPDPRCSQKYDNNQDLINHIHDIHRTPKYIFTSTTKKRKATCHECDSCQTEGDRRLRKKICLNHMVFELGQNQSEMVHSPPVVNWVLDQGCVGWPILDTLSFENE
jgi:hypothetical protein